MSVLLADVLMLVLARYLRLIPTASYTVRVNCEQYAE